jgi:8-oxo-dGTP pyrophosphatase MutT (NUDIX family)
MSWTVHGSRTVHDGSPWLRVDMVDVTAPNGERFDHAAIRIPDAAVALIVDGDAVLMLHRQRWVIGRDGYELFGGLVDEGEDPAETARREVLEESGYRPRGPGEHLMTIHPMPGIVDSAMHLYLWRHGADRVTVPSDPHEVGTITWMPLERVDELARTGRPDPPAARRADRTLGAAAGGGAPAGGGRAGPDRGAPGRAGGHRPRCRPVRDLPPWRGRARAHRPRIPAAWAGLDRRGGRPRPRRRLLLVHHHQSPTPARESFGR